MNQIIISKYNYLLYFIFNIEIMSESTVNKLLHLQLPLIKAKYEDDDNDNDY